MLDFMFCAKCMRATDGWVEVSRDASTVTYRHKCGYARTIKLSQSLMERMAAVFAPEGESKSEGGS